jgi:ABC-type transport system involved in multi-copper enzyme maturation permease subunit
VNQGRDGEFSNILLAMCGYLGFFIVIVAGIGVLLDDLKPGLHTFWRSRPINPDLWFWTKFLTGLTITAIALGIPLLLALGIMLPYREYHREVIFTIPAVYLSIYCFAVVAMALVRQPIYAAIFAIGLIAFCSFTIERLLPRSFEFQAEAVCVMATVLSFLATLTAWLAVRYDIGYKG